MALSKRSKAISLDLPECPVCLETMSAPIFQCSSGHSLCHACTKKLMPPKCPLCNQSMTHMRNWQLEDIVHKAKVACPNEAYGCVYTLMNAKIADHLKECIFREMDCPLGLLTAKCSWEGRITEMKKHFKECHADNCTVSPGTDIILENINTEVDKCSLDLLSYGKLLFVMTFKIDTLHKMAYWCIQHIGCKNIAKNHIYEIHVCSNQDARRKVVYIEHCFNDSVKADEVFSWGKCAMLPLECLSNFIKDKKLTFRYIIKRLPNEDKIAQDNGGVEYGASNSNHPSGSGPKHPQPRQGPKKNKVHSQSYNPFL